MKSVGVRPISERRKNQRGFALLVIFLMAAAIALMLYIQLPRVAFETEREKERLLIDRGEQYKRAIQLYYVAFQRYPTRIEDLENTNDKRFLRRRYVNPYTGKDDWRLIHINGGMLTDSLVQKAPPAGGLPGGGLPGGQLAGSSSSPTTPATQASNGIDPNAPTTPAPVNQAVLQRPSDRTLPTNNSYNQTFTQTAAANPFPNPVPGQPNSFQQNPANFNDPATFPPISLYPNGYNSPPVNQPGVNQPGLNQPGFNQPGLNQPGFNQPGFNPGLNQPGLNLPGSNQQGVNLNQPGQGFNQPGINQPGFGFNQPGTNQPGQNQPPLNPPAFGQPAGNVPGVTPQSFPPQQVVLNPQTGQPVAGGLPGGFVPGLPGQAGQPGQAVQPGINPNFANQFPTTTDPNNFNAGFNAGVNAGGQNPVTQTPPGGIVPATPGGGAPNQAINLINQLLTTPRQPPPGLGATTAQPTAGPAGIAGIASSYTGPSIMSYGNRTEFEEWEFVFQPNAQGTSGVGPQQQNPNGNPPNGQPGQPTPGGTPFPGFPPAGFPPPGLPQGFPPTGAPGLPAGRP